jgi:hypothetical protein
MTFDPIQVLGGTLGFLFSLAVLAVVAYLAILIYVDAAKRPTRVMGIPPWLWCLLVVVGNVVGLLAYWLIHHSTLAERSHTDA